MAKDHSKINKKIMYLADTYESPYAGTEGQMKMLIEGMKGVGMLPRLTLLRDSEYIKENGFICPVDILDVHSLFNPVSFIKIMQFAKKIKQDGYSLVHIFFNDSSLLAPVVLRMLGIRVIISRRDMGFWYSPLKLFVLRFNSFFINRVIVNSKAVASITAKKEKINTNKIEVIYNGYDFKCSDDIENQGLSDDELSKFNSALVVGLVANIRKIKRIDDLIRAVPLVLEKIPSVKFLVIGGGDADELTDMADKLSVKDDIIFLGQKSNASDYIKLFDVGVLCSESEGFSNSIIEYMQAHTAVVCTDVGGNSEIVFDGKSGFLIDVGDVENLAGSILKLLLDKQLCTEMADFGYEYVTSNFSRDKMLNQHVTLYEELA